MKVGKISKSKEMTKEKNFKKKWQILKIDTKNIAYG